MKWKIFKEDDKHCVYEIDEKGDKGKLDSSHDVEKDATGRINKLMGMGYMEIAPPPIDVESFEELDEHRELSAKMAEFQVTSRDFLDMTENIVYYSHEDTVDEKGRKVVKLASEYAARIKEQFTKDKSGLLDKLIKQVSNIINPAPQSFLLFKSEGETRWIARYSNNIRDVEKEIIASKSHKRFVELVDKGEAPYPDLLVWHEKEWKIGSADWVAYDDSGYALASGTLNKEAEGIAAWLSVQKDICMSHGMPFVTVKRDENDPLIIIEHETVEISILPKAAAANKLTGWYVIGKEQTEMIPENKKIILSKWGLGEDVLAGLEQLNKAEASAAKEDGLDSKELDTEDVDADTEDAGGEDVDAEDTDAEDAGTENAVTEDADAEEKSVTRDEIAEALEFVVKQMSEGFTRLNARMDGFDENIQKQISTKLSETPTASLLGMLSRDSSVISKEETKIDGREKLAKDGPEEVKAEVGEGKTGVPFIDKMRAGGK